MRSYERSEGTEEHGKGSGQTGWETLSRESERKAVHPPPAGKLCRLLPYRLRLGVGAVAWRTRPTVQG